VIGVLLGMLFRYWSYKRWVFLAFEPGQETAVLGTAAPPPPPPPPAIPPIQPAAQQDPLARPAARVVPPRPVLKPDR
jgi:hypothetical protein